MIYSISNDILNIAIAEKGAELQSIIHTEYGIEYLWSGDAKFWGKKSPVLFPVVGTLKNNNYEYKDRKYNLGRHGFARDMNFTVTAHTDDAITFTLTEDENTLQKYPFHFRFSLRYAVQENQLHITYITENVNDAEIFFSVGGHPAFKVPLIEGTAFEDYYLAFAEIEDAGRWPLSADGLIEGFTIPVLDNTNILPLTKALLYEDALVFKHLRSKNISLLSHKTLHGLKLDFDGFPFLGIWNAKDADFVCIEPWCGIADSVHATGKLEEKEGIIVLLPFEKFEKMWSIELF